MKTKNAFAFRNFDSSRILQCPFFKDFYFETDKSDEKILQSLSKATEDSVDSWEKNLYVIKATYERLTEFRNLIDRHNEKRLAYFYRKPNEKNKRRVNEMEYFSASLSVLELMNKFEKLYYEIEKKIQSRYRTEFANRLKGIRKNLGLTQKQLGALIQVSPQAFSLYERGEQDIPVYTVIRLAKDLNTSSDQLLGLK